MTEVAATVNASAPVMDVVAPPVEKKTETDVETDPVDQLAAADQRAQQSLTQDKPEKLPKSGQKKQVAESSATPHQAGVSLAITATVIIVLSLATLATYAYLQTNK